MNIITIKTHVMRINPRCTVAVDDQPLEVVKEFSYLGSPMSIDNAISKDVSAQFGEVLLLPDCGLCGSQSIITSKPS